MPRPPGKFQVSLSSPSFHEAHLALVCPDPESVPFGLLALGSVCFPIRPVSVGPSPVWESNHSPRSSEFNSELPDFLLFVASGGSVFSAQ